MNMKVKNQATIRFTARAVRAVQQVLTIEPEITSVNAAVNYLLEQGPDALAENDALRSENLRLSIENRLFRELVGNPPFPRGFQPDHVSGACESRAKPSHSVEGGK